MEAVKELTVEETAILGTGLVSHIMDLLGELDGFDGNPTRRDMYGKLEDADHYEKQLDKATALLKKHWPELEADIQMW
jgi:hypothetical protein